MRTNVQHLFYFLYSYDVLLWVMDQDTHIYLIFNFVICFDIYDKNLTRYYFFLVSNFFFSEPDYYFCDNIVLYFSVFILIFVLLYFYLQDLNTNTYIILGFLYFFIDLIQIMFIYTDFHDLLTLFLISLVYVLMFLLIYLTFLLNLFSSLFFTFLPIIQKTNEIHINTNPHVYNLEYYFNTLVDRNIYNSIYFIINYLSLTFSDYFVY